jgi:hypothetical protein
MRHAQSYSSLYLVTSTAGSAQPFPTEAAVAGANLRIDLVALEVVDAFEAAGVASILLKGPALARLLYQSSAERPYVDVDLLVKPDDWNRACEVLSALDFASRNPAPGIPLDRAPYGREWRRGRDGANVDLHEGLAETTADRAEAWTYLWSHREQLILRGHPVWVLDVPCRAMLIALHAAHHRGAVAKTLEDLRRAVAALPEDVWHEAAVRATHLGCEIPFAAGLRFVPEGETMATRLGLADDPWLAGILFDSPGDEPSLAVALGFQRLDEIKGWRAKGAYTFRKLFPPPRYMDGWIDAHPGRGGIAIAYLRRLARMLRHLAGGVRRWRAVKRTPVRKEDDQ